MELRFLKKKDKPFLVLDIGTEAVKSLIVRKDSKIRILGSGISYIEEEGYFGKSIPAGDLEIETIKRAIENSVKEASISAMPFLKKGEKLENLEVLLSLNPKKLRAQVLEEVSIREEKEKKIKKSEKKAILQNVLESAKKDTFKVGLNKLGFLAEDIEIVYLEVLNREIEGYSIPNILGCQGKDLIFKILVVFGPKSYIDGIKKILNDLDLKVLKIVHLSQAIKSIFNKKNQDGIFFDVGGEITQMFLLDRGILNKVELFERGGDDFTESIFSELNLSKRDARILKERYSNKSLDPETALRIKKTLSSEKELWRKTIEKYQKSLVFLFGGSVSLPEIKDVLENKKIVCIKNFKQIEDLSKKTKEPQFIPVILTSLL